MIMVHVELFLMRSWNECLFGFSFIYFFISLFFSIFPFFSIDYASDGREFQSFKYNSKSRKFELNLNESHYNEQKCLNWVHLIVFFIIIISLFCTLYSLIYQQIEKIWTRNKKNGKIDCIILMISLFDVRQTMWYNHGYNNTKSVGYYNY